MRRKRDGETYESREAVARFEEAGWFLFGLNDSTVEAALEVLSEKNIGAVLVMEGTKLIGIFSERDYARKGELQGRTAGSTAIREVMTSSVASVTLKRLTSAEG